jgi:hypothetical protein
LSPNRPPAWARAAIDAQPIILDQILESQVFGETRHYRILLLPDYETSGKRYPVIYWFHGWSERYNKPVTRDPGRCTYAPRVGTEDLIRFYHARMNAISNMTIGHGCSGWPMRFSPISNWARLLDTMPETLH